MIADAAIVFFFVVTLVCLAFTMTAKRLLRGMAIMVIGTGAVAWGVLNGNMELFWVVLAAVALYLALDAIIHLGRLIMLLSEREEEIPLNSSKARDRGVEKSSPIAIAFWVAAIICLGVYARWGHIYDWMLVDYGQVLRQYVIHTWS